MTFNRLLDTLVYCDDERFKQEFQTQCENVVGPLANLIPLR